MYELINGTWPWYVSGPLIGLLALALSAHGERFGVSSSLRHVCAATVPRTSRYLQYDWRSIGGWNLAFVAGIAIGGVVTGFLLPGSGNVPISATTITALRDLGLTNFDGLAPAEIFAWERLFTLPSFIFMVVGGFLVGFGARWADGCTSGHAISGIAEFKLSSIVATIGFFAGGLLVTYFVLPLLLGGAT
jgi:uncharacterized membrane protein YedE/YeeE